MNPDLGAGIAALESRATRKLQPGRHEVRPILIAIGESLLAGRDEEARTARERILQLPPSFLQKWEEAVLEELSMACTEHIRSLDRRYLSLPDYDWSYAIEARRRLEARIVAASLLGIRLSEEMLAGVSRADRLLESHGRPGHGK